MILSEHKAKILDGNLLKEIEILGNRDEMLELSEHEVEGMY